MINNVVEISVGKSHVNRYSPVMSFIQKKQLYPSIFLSFSNGLSYVIEM